MRSTLLKGVALTLGLGVGTQAGTGARVTLRVVNSARVASRVLGQGQKRASYVLGRAGVEATWQDCPEGEVGPCARPLERNEFWLHVAGWKPTKQSVEMLGFTARDEDTAGGTDVAGVYYPMVRELASSFQVEEGDVLGAALAHEIGHLLGAGHAPTGVMRARLNRQCIVELSQGGFLFNEDQAARIRVAAIQRILLQEFP